MARRPMGVARKRPAVIATKTVCLPYLNPAHLAQMKETFPDPADFANMLRLLEMELIVDRKIVHPQVAWAPATRQRAV